MAGRPLRRARMRNPHNLVVNPYKEKILLPSGNVQYVYSEQDIAKRHAEKAQRIEQLKSREQRLRSAVKEGTEAGDPVAMAVALIMATYERVGNTESAADGHYGVTGWEARHAKVEGSKDDIFGEAAGGARRKTEEGFAIYTEAELGLGGKGGDTDLCPFDCQCCY